MIYNKLHQEADWVYYNSNRNSKVILSFDKEFTTRRCMYINEYGVNSFEDKIFEAGSDFRNGKAVVKDPKDKKWKLIDTSGHTILNISDKFKQEILVVVNSEQNDIYRITLKRLLNKFISSEGIIHDEIDQYSFIKQKDYKLHPRLLQRLDSYDLTKYSANSRNHFILYDTVVGSKKTYGVIYSDEYEPQYLISKTTKDTIEPISIRGSYIIGKSNDLYHIYNKSNLNYIASTDLMPYKVTDKLILSRRKNKLVYDLNNNIIFNPSDKYGIASNKDSILISKDEVKELILIDPTETELLNLNEYKNLEVITLKNYKQKMLPWNEINSLSKLEVMNLVGCNLVTVDELNRVNNQLRYLDIEYGELLNNFEPNESKWSKLEMYSKRFVRYTTKYKRELTIGDKL